MRNPAYLSAVRNMPCCACENLGEIQRHRTEAHHFIGLGGTFDGFTIKGGGLAMKSPDREAIPLCGRHHLQGNYGEAIHAGVERWQYMQDKMQWEFVKETQEALGWVPPG